MSLLDQLWDDTVAGPLPESGLGKLRKMPSSGLRPNPGKESGGGSVMKSYREEATTVDEKRVTRSIMIVRPPGYTNVSSTTPPASPAGSTPPVSPFAESPFGFEGGLHRMHTRSQPRLDPEILLLLTACEI
ncbi:PREDICTED: auxin-repressed 12.5 kDa protein-like isoform X5 [Populus euphratica]|uniref:Auxin-repressed 12.5 kDa protein-like isoform X5 n=1 Tax=Populus euphratica TaxID=75702 RepID=A0AAJ6XZJ8_POPEU|nr:PREDICTED: auxin-repressed 12.5 kDa protein-like isoform X5 [Populus euphratica]